MKYTRGKNPNSRNGFKILWDINNGETLCENCHKTLRRNIVNYPHVLKLNLQKTI